MHAITPNQNLHKKEQNLLLKVLYFKIYFHIQLWIKSRQISELLYQSLQSLFNMYPPNEENQNAIIGDQMYEVQQILARKRSSRGMLYQIKWKNYPDPKDFTWEPMQNLSEVFELVEEFNRFQDQRIKKKSLKQEQVPIKQTYNNKKKIKSISKKQDGSVDSGNDSQKAQENQKKIREKKQESPKRQRKKIISSISAGKVKTQNKSTNKMKRLQKIRKDSNQSSKNSILNEEHSKELKKNDRYKNESKKLKMNGNDINHFTQSNLSNLKTTKTAEKQVKKQIEKQPIFGHINSHFLNNLDQLVFDVSFLNKQGLTVQCKILTYKELYHSQYHKLIQYLERNLQFLLSMQCLQNNQNK